MTNLAGARRKRYRALDRAAELAALLILFGVRYLVGAIFGWPVEALDLVFITVGALTAEVITTARYHRRITQTRKVST
jgi:hypothetical protein